MENPPARFLAGGAAATTGALAPVAGAWAGDSIDGAGEVEGGVVLTLVIGATGGTVATPLGILRGRAVIGVPVAPRGTASGRLASCSSPVETAEADGSGLVDSGGSLRAGKVTIGGSIFIGSVRATVPVRAGTHSITSRNGAWSAYTV